MDSQTPHTHQPGMVLASDWLQAADLARAKFEDGRLTLAQVRTELFILSRAARTQGNVAVSCEILALAWNMDSADISSGRPNEHELLAHPQIHVAVDEIAKAKVVLFVMGCARSGTTLQKLALTTVQNPVYFLGENSISRIRHDWPTDGDVLIVKRKSTCHKYVDLIPPHVRVVYMVRHPYSTMTSILPKTGKYYLDPKRWCDEFLAYKHLRKRHPENNLVVVRYEDLTGSPDEVQRRIAAKFGLQFDIPFTRYTERNFLERKLNKDGSVWRWAPFRAGRSNSPKYEEHRAKIDEFRVAAGPLLQEFSQAFGYEI